LHKKGQLTLISLDFHLSVEGFVTIQGLIKTKGGRARFAPLRQSGKQLFVAKQRIQVSSQLVMVSRFE
jgi:hypothetical protein